MSGINLHVVSAVGPSQLGAVITNKIQQQVDSTDSQSWDAEKKELIGYVVAIFADKSKRQRYNQALQGPLLPSEIMTDFLANLATVRSSHGLNTLGQGSVGASRGHNAVGGMIPTVSSEPRNSVVMRTVITTFVSVQPLTLEATPKDVWVCIPKTIQAVIVTLTGLAVFWIGGGTFTFVQNLEYFESPWFMSLKVVISIFFRIAILRIIVMTSVSGFTGSEVYRQLKVGFLLAAALVPGLSLISDTAIFVIDAPFLVFDYHFRFYYWWGFTCYLVLSIFALVLCLLPQPLVWYRGAMLVKTTPQGSQPETIPPLVKGEIRRFSAPFSIVNVQRQYIWISFTLFTSGFEVQSRKSF